ncbi:DUF4174 domain-containing protein [Alteromonas halophila]|uniref:DUF4174 domain-containing protein n=1 Tax=Alteromonas halophila TaxID=516698 RepID=A0A918JMC8_9ALTE|nr:DUF4174 domain-containing protein [Alteromonas halophila]GGW89396.1 hypothetical protein GCM10007391_24550 [Alteromonas halophila]
MKRIVFIGLFILFSVPGLQAHAALSQYQWQYRVLLVRADTQSQASELLTKIRQAEVQVKERKLTLQILTRDGVLSYPDSAPSLSAQAIRRRLRDASVLLIGLDGRDKATYDALRIEAVFDDIDVMPMRGAELNRQ